MQANENMNPGPRTLRLVITGLIVISTILFVAGVAIEHSRVAGAAQATHQEASKEGVAATATPQPGEAGEGQGGAEGSGGSSEAHAGTATAEGSQAQESREARKETVLGIDVENPWVVTGFVIGWLALIVALFVFGRLGLVAVTLAAIVALVFDIGEVGLQFGMADALVGGIAAVVAAAHAAIAALSVWSFTRG